MKKLLFKILLILVGFLIINQIFNSLYYNRIESYMDNERKLKEFVHFDGKLKYLFLGSSHSQNAIDPSIIGNSYNFASSLESCLQTYYKLKATVEDLKKEPEYVIIPVDLSTFSQFRVNRFRNESSLLHFSDYWELYRITGEFEYIAQYINTKFFLYSGKVKFLRRFFKTRRAYFLKNPRLGFKDQQGNLLEDFPNGPDAECKRKANLYFNEGTYWNKYAVIYFEKILNYCKANNIKFVGIKMPLSENYIKECSRFFSIEEFNMRVDSLFKPYKSNASLIDLRHEFRDHQDYFWNPDHIGASGAVVLSPLIKAKLDSIDQSHLKHIENTTFTTHAK